MENKNSDICPNCQTQMAIKTYKYHKLIICKKCYLTYEWKSIFNYSEDWKCCTNPTLQYVKYKSSSGSVLIRQQCFSCGYLNSKTFAKKNITNPEALEFYSEQLLELYQKKEEQKHIDIKKEWEYYRGTIMPKILELRREKEYATYTNYLQTPIWKEKREYVLVRDKHLCQSCLKNKATEVHHLDYRFLGNEPLFTLISVCRTCHEAIELMKDGKDADIIKHK